MIYYCLIRSNCCLYVYIKIRMKVLVSADCNGWFSTLLPKVSQLHDKNHFDCLFLVGSVCPLQSSLHIPKLISQQLKLSLPTFFIDSSQMSGVLGSLHPEGYQIVQNFQFLGSFGVRKIKSLNVAYLNGIQLPIQQYPMLGNKELSYSGRYFNEHQVDELIKIAESIGTIDVLLTSQWAFQYPSSADETMSKSKLVSKLVQAISPRYHFAAGGKTFTRMDPYKSSQGHPTHFINVAPIIDQNPTGKYLFAINISQDPYQNAPTTLIPSPFEMIQPQQMQDEDKLKQAKIMVQKSQQRNAALQQQPPIVDKNTHIYFENVSQNTQNNQIIEFLERWGEITTIQVFDPKKHKKSGIVKFREIQSTEICLKDTGKYSLYNQRIRFTVSKVGGRARDDECWFCIGTKVFDEKLLVYKGEHSYISMDKGPINQNHLQLVPIAHHGERSKLTKEQIEEIGMFKSLLTNHYKEKKLLPLTFQKVSNLSSNINHWVEHFLPVGRTEKQLVQKFKEINTRDRLGFKLKNFKDKGETIKFYAQVNIGQTSFIKELDRKERRDVIREVVCILLDNIPAIDWRQSERSNQNVLLYKKRLSQELALIFNE